MKALIPARGGSKGLHLKNLCLVDGVPLVSIAIREARKAGLEPVVTTDYHSIGSIAESEGAEVIKRPKQLANSTANLKDVAIHAAQELALDPEESILILLPTYPTRTSVDIVRFKQFYEGTIADSAVCLVPCRDHPSLCLQETRKGWQPISDLVYRRQQRPTVMRILHFNVAVRVGRLELLDDGFVNHTTAFHLLKDHPIDIDTSDDLRRANGRR